MHELDVMLDLETMGNGPDAAIVAIGAVVFGMEEGVTNRCFYETITLESSMEHGGVADASTIMWWLEQDDEARKELVRGGVSILYALDSFFSWVMGTYGTIAYVRVWGNGAAFDNVILSSAYRRAHKVQPWKFWNDRCYRTVKSMCPSVEIERTGTHHNALDDAVSQAEHLVRIMRHIAAGGLLHGQNC